MTRILLDQGLDCDLKVRHATKGQFSSKGETVPNGRTTTLQPRAEKEGGPADAARLQRGRVGAGTGSAPEVAVRVARPDRRAARFQRSRCEVRSGGSRGAGHAGLEAGGRNLGAGEPFFSASLAASRGTTAKRRRWFQRCVWEEIRTRHQQQGGLTVERMCELAKVDRAGYYRWRRRREPEDHNMEIRDRIQRICLGLFGDSPGCSPREITIFAVFSPRRKKQFLRKPPSHPIYYQ